MEGVGKLTMSAEWSNHFTQFSVGKVRCRGVDRGESDVIGWGFDGGVGLGEAGLIAESLIAESQSGSVTIEIRLARREQRTAAALTLL